MVKLISITKGAGELEGKTAQEIISYAARVSNPSNQNNFETAPKLLSYCIKHQHWSIFEQASITMEIKTSRGIAAQILRHKSFQFQEYSQRFSQATNFVSYEARRQDLKNKQNSIEDMSDQDKEWFKNAQRTVWLKAYDLYNEALSRGIAKECARNLLPLGTETTLYMTGTVRSWIHYIQVRASEDTQKEHRDIANACKVIFCEQMPDVAKALGWELENDYSIL